MTGFETSRENLTVSNIINRAIDHDICGAFNDNSRIRRARGPGLATAGRMTEGGLHP